MGVRTHVYRERQRQRQRETDRQRDRQRQIDRETDRERELLSKTVDTSLMKRNFGPSALCVASDLVKHIIWDEGCIDHHSPRASETAPALFK